MSAIDETINQELSLTKLSKSSGCGCKIAPAVLQEILQGNTSAGSGEEFSDLLVGNDTADDAAVYKINEQQALISTVDFFTPVVDDPYIWGQIAAANAISDVYAMGGTPVLATAILGWPLDKLDTTTAGKVLAGARLKCREAGIPLAGGHSIESTEPFFGLSVNGLIAINGVKTNAGARPGDLVFLTKPLGSGVLSTAIKRGLITEESYTEAVKYMTMLNSFGKKLQAMDTVHALTDVTGFGFAGHLVEVCKASKCSTEINYAKLPLMKGTGEYSARFCFPDNTYRNWNAIAEDVEGINAANFVALCDPQTNGGLLIVIDPAAYDQYRQLAIAENLPELCHEPVGYIVEKGEKLLYIK